MKSGYKGEDIDKNLVKYINAYISSDNRLKECLK